jgi:hypothetical protein
MPKSVNLDTLEEDINGVFLDFLRRGGVDVDNLEAMAKVKHNTFDRALQAVYDTLFKPDKCLENNQKSLLPYNDNTVLNNIINIYIKLCNSTDNDSTIRGFCCLTGYDDNSVYSWIGDELNPERRDIVKRIQKSRVDMIENKLSDHPIGATALANNSASLGMMWARNNQPVLAQKAVYILPAEQTRKEIGAGLPYAITSGESEESA